MPNCPEKPEELVSQPIGMYHCPYCGMMLIAGFPHPLLEDDYNYEGPEPEDSQLPGGPLE